MAVPMDSAMHESDQTLEGKSVPAMQGLTEFVIRDGHFIFPVA